MDKWIETQQIISKERKDWQQGKDILTGRLELVQKEADTLAAKIVEAESNVATASQKRAELEAENNQLKEAGAQLNTTVAGMEETIRQLFKQLPEPVQTRLKPLYDRIPTDASRTIRISTAERYQNVLGILNELNKASNDITVSYEVHNLSDGKPAEVQAIYVGLAQAYYVSVRGEAGIGRPSANGWQWEPSNSCAREILSALEIIQGKHTPAFVPFPVKIQ